MIKNWETSLNVGDKKVETCVGTNNRQEDAVRSVRDHEFSSLRAVESTMRMFDVFGN